MSGNTIRLDKERSEILLAAADRIRAATWGPPTTADVATTQTDYFMPPGRAAATAAAYPGVNCFTIAGAVAAELKSAGRLDCDIDPAESDEITDALTGLNMTGLGERSRNVLFGIIDQSYDPERDDELRPVAASVQSAQTPYVAAGFLALACAQVPTMMRPGRDVDPRARDLGMAALLLDSWHRSYDAIGDRWSADGCSKLAKEVTALAQGNLRWRETAGIDAGKRTRGAGHGR